MAAALAGGIAAGLILAFLLLLASAPSWRPWCLIGYVVFALVLAGASGIQINVETSWMAPNATMNRAMKNEIGPALPRPAFAVGLPGLRVRVVLVIDMKIPAAFDFADAAGGEAMRSLQA